MSEHIFCRMLLKTTRDSLTAKQRKELTGSWAYNYGDGTVEFQNPRDGFYWHGSGCCKYSAKSDGISAWLWQNYPDQD